MVVLEAVGNSEDKSGMKNISMENLPSLFSIISGNIRGTIIVTMRQILIVDVNFPGKVSLA